MYWGLTQKEHEEHSSYQRKNISFFNMAGLRGLRIIRSCLGTQPLAFEIIELGCAAGVLELYIEPYQTSIRDIAVHSEQVDCSTDTSSDVASGND